MIFRDVNHSIINAFNKITKEQSLLLIHFRSILNNLELDLELKIIKWKGLKVLYKNHESIESMSKDIDAIAPLFYFFHPVFTQISMKRITLSNHDL